MQGVQRCTRARGEVAAGLLLGARPCTLRAEEGLSATLPPSTGRTDDTSEWIAGGPIGALALRNVGPYSAPAACVARPPMRRTSFRLGAGVPTTSAYSARLAGERSQSGSADAMAAA